MFSKHTPILLSFFLLVFVLKVCFGQGNTVVPILKYLYHI